MLYHDNDFKTYVPSPGVIVQSLTYNVLTKYFFVLANRDNIFQSCNFYNLWVLKTQFVNNLLRWLNHIINYLSSAYKCNVSISKYENRI